MLNGLITSLFLIFLENAMATEKLSEGIRKFAIDGVKLEKKVVQYLSERTS